MRQTLALLALLALVSTQIINAVAPAKAARPVFYVTLCHRGQTLVVPLIAVLPHWRHGDIIGRPCPATPVSTATTRPTSTPRATATSRPTSTPTPRPTSTDTPAPAETPTESPTPDVD